MRTVLMTSVALVSGATTLSAQDLVEACEALERITVGQWAEYQISSPDPQGNGQARFAIVDMEEVDGQEYYWYETRMMVAPMGTMVMQMLVPSYPYSSSEIRAAVMQMGDQPAMAVPDEALGMMQSLGSSNPGMAIAQQCDAAELVGEEAITVSAGTFDALHLRIVDGSDLYDLWMSVDIPFGLIRMTGPGVEVNLLGHGLAATSSIGGRPVVSSPPEAPEAPDSMPVAVPSVRGFWLLGVPVADAAPAARMTRSQDARPTTRRPPA